MQPEPTSKKIGSDYGSGAALKKWRLQPLRLRLRNTGYEQRQRKNYSSAIYKYKPFRLCVSDVGCWLLAKKPVLLLLLWWWWGRMQLVRTSTVVTAPGAALSARLCCGLCLSVSASFLISTCLAGSGWLAPSLVYILYMSESRKR